MKVAKQTGEAELNVYSQECDSCGLIRGIIRRKLNVALCEKCYQAQLVIA